MPKLPGMFTPRPSLAAAAAALGTAALLLLGCSSAAPSKTLTGNRIMSTTTQALPLATYERQALQFKPERGLAATNPNDVRRFLYDWFTHFEHASAVDYYLGHLDDQNMSLVFPGMAPFTSHAAFSGWYQNLLAQTLWNFHDLSAIQVRQTGPQHYLVSFVVDWYGEVRPGSEQLAGWQSRGDSHLYHHRLRQTWTVRAGERLVIEKLVVTGGDTPSPISE